MASGLNHADTGSTRVGSEVRACDLGPHFVSRFVQTVHLRGKFPAQGDRFLAWQPIRHGVESHLHHVGLGQIAPRKRRRAPCEGQRRAQLVTNTLDEVLPGVLIELIDEAPSG